MAERVVVNKKTGKIVGRVFKFCKNCSILADQNHKGNVCPHCGGELKEVNLIFDTGEEGNG